MTVLENVIEGPIHVLVKQVARARKPSPIADRVA